MVISARKSALFNGKEATMAWKVITGREYNGKPYCDGIVEENSYVIKVGYDYYEEYIVQTDSGVYGPKLEDAYVMAAAKELLAALEITKAAWIYHADAQQCLAAIAKARLFSKPFTYHEEIPE